MSWYHPTSLLDKVFEGGIIIKGLTGLLEFIGGLLLLFVSPDQMRQFVTVITQRELLEDPNDRVANLLLHATSHFSAGGKTFLIYGLRLDELRAWKITRERVEEVPLTA